MASHIFTRMGYLVTARWFDDAIRVTVNDEAETVVLEQESETGLDIAEAPDGRLSMVYQDADGVVLRLWSADHGRTWGA